MEMECVPPSNNGVIVRLMRRRGDGRRPAFMESLPPGGPPRDRDRGHFVQLLGGGGRNRSSSLFPDNSQYIGYLSDDERVNDVDAADAGAGAGAGGDFRRRRRELLRLDSDVSFTGSVCLFVIVSFVIALFVFLVAASPWGVSPPSLGGGGGGGRRR